MSRDVCVREGGTRPGGDGRVGSWTTVAMLDRDGRSVAISDAKEAVTMEGRDEAWQRTSLWRIATADAAMNVAMDGRAAAGR